MSSCGSCLSHLGNYNSHLHTHLTETRGEVIMGLVIPFVMPRGPEPKPSTRGPTLTGLGQDSNPAKVPVSYLGPSATAMPLIGGPALSTPAGLDIDANIAEDPTLKPIARGKTKSVRCIPLYSLGSTPIVYNNLCIELDSYPFQNDKLQLVRGFKFGFPLQYAGPRIYYEAKNLKSARDAPHIVQQKLDKEVSLGRMAGPFDEIPFPTFRVSPVGLVPKKDGDFRLIHHLSYPDFNSVNYFIDPDICKVKYSNIDEAVLMIQLLGQGTLLAKTDLKSAFRLLPIYPGDFDLLGIKLGDKYYFDKCLPFGSKLSCALFNKFSTFLHWLTSKKSGSQNIIHYLDDFLFAGRSDDSICKHTLHIFHLICARLGVPIADDKTVEPTTCLTFLGIELDTVAMQMRLPASKLDELRTKVQTTILTPTITLQDLQSIIGLLNFACQVVAPGRAFIRRLIDATVGVKQAKSKITVTSWMKLDLEMWLDFLNQYNGITLFPSRLWVSNDTIQFFTDSAGGRSGGFGIFFHNKWAFGRWPHQWVKLGRLQDMTYLELFPVVVALHVWGPLLANKKILFHIDNQAVVYIVNKQTSKSIEVMSLVRKLVLYTLKFNITFKAEYIYTKHNAIADSISRCQWPRFRALAPYADPTPTPLPPEIWQF